MKEYKQLTEEDHIDIYAMKQAEKKQNAIASKLGVNPGTISRELERNTGNREYRPRKSLGFLTPNEVFYGRKNINRITKQDLIQLHL